MAILKFGPTVTGLRGTVAGSIFSANKAGPYVRAWSRSANRRTPSQTNVRSILAHAAGLWRAEDSGDRDDWDTWAALPAQARTNSLGQEYFLSGFQWYTALNIRLQLMGRDWRSVYPSSDYPAAPPITAVTVTESGVGGTMAAYYPNLTFDDFDLVWSLAVTQGLGQQSTLSGFYDIKRDMAPGATVTYSGAGFRDVVGYVVAGNSYHSRLYRQTTDGMRSAPTSVYSVAV